MGNLQHYIDNPYDSTREIELRRKAYEESCKLSCKYCKARPNKKCRTASGTIRQREHSVRYYEGFQKAQSQ